MICTVNALGTQVAPLEPAAKKSNGVRKLVVFPEAAIGLVFTVSATQQTVLHWPAKLFARSGRMKVPKTNELFPEVNLLVVRTVVYGPTGLGKDKWCGHVASHTPGPTREIPPKALFGTAPTP